MGPQLLVALALLVAVGPSAVAGPSGAACRLVVDPEGDDYVAPEAAGAPVSAPSLDIVSADVATNPRHVTGVVRVRDLSPDPAAGGGGDYVVGFTVNGQRFSMTGGRGVDGGTRFWVTHSGTLRGVSAGRILAHVDGVFDEDASEVRISAPRVLFTEVTRISSGSRLSGLWAETERIVGVASTGGATPSPHSFTISSTADDATTTASYAADSPSCVPVGR